MSTLSNHIDRLRTLRADDRPAPTTGHLRMIADDIYDNVDLPSTLARTELAGYTAADVVTFAEGFGKFRAQSMRGNAKAGTELSDDLGLITFGLGRDEIKTIADAVQRYRSAEADGRKWKPRKGDPSLSVVSAWSADAPAGLTAEVPDVVVPRGYEPEATGRQIRVSLAALVNTRPSDEEIGRYWDRTFAEKPRELTAEHVYLVWWLAHHDLGDVLDDLTDRDIHVASLLVRAHDLLATAMSDTRRGLAALCAGPEDLGRARELVEDCSWVHEGMFTRLRDTVCAALENPSERLTSRVSSGLDTLRRWVDSGVPELRSISALNEGHLMHLCRRAGLEVDSGEEKRVRDTIRAHLIDLGLRADLDRDIPSGLSAWRSGRLEEFMSSMDAKAQGDPEWAALCQVSEDEAVLA